MKRFVDRSVHEIWHIVPFFQMREKKEKQHEAAQKAHSQKQLEAAKKQNVEKLVCSLKKK